MYTRTHTYICTLRNVTTKEETTEMSSSGEVIIKLTVVDHHKLSPGPPCSPVTPVTLAHLYFGAYGRAILVE